MDDIVSGAYVFTGERSARSYHLNKMANTLSVPDKRVQFQADEASYMRAMGCSDDEIELVKQRDWKGMMDLMYPLIFGLSPLRNERIQMEAFGFQIES